MFIDVALIPTYSNEPIIPGSISECASKIFPISFEDEICTTGCETVGKGIIGVSDAFAIYGSANQGNSYMVS